MKETRKVDNPYPEIWEWKGIRYTVKHISQVEITKDGKIVEFVNRYKVLKVGNKPKK